MLLVTKVLHLMMQDCSTAHTFLYRWFVQLEKTHSSQKSGSRLVTESLLTPSPVVLLLMILVSLHVIVISTIDVLRSQTLCKKKGNISFFTKSTPSGVDFFLSFVIIWGLDLKPVLGQYYQLISFKFNVVLYHLI